MRTLILICLAAALAGCGVTPFYMGPQPSTEFGRSVDHMPERVRASIATVSVQPGERTPVLYVGGDYGDSGPDVGDSARAGAADGARFTGELITEDPRALIVVPFVLPLAMIAGSIAGTAGAKIGQQIREYRDGLTDDMLDESNPRLPSARLADELRGFVGRVRGVEHVDADADATLTITLSEIAIIIDGNDADMSATTRVLLTDRDGKRQYANTHDHSDHQPRFDLEIYDGTRVVYAAHNIEGRSIPSRSPCPIAGRWAGPCVQS